MNTLPPLLGKALRFLESRLAGRFGKPPARRPRFEVQLEFPWLPKR